MGISAVQNGLRAVSLGRKALAFRKFLPGGRRKAAGRAMQKAEKQAVQANTKTLRKKDRRRACGFGGAKKIFLTKING